jgi:hypothetical protein
MLRQGQIGRMAGLRAQLKVGLRLGIKVYVLWLDELAGKIL